MKMKQCPYCGQELNKSDRQCSNCGNMIPKEKIKQHRPLNQNNLI